MGQYVDKMSYPIACLYILSLCFFVIQFDQGGLYFKRDVYVGSSAEKYHTAFVDYYVAIIKLLGGEESEAREMGEEIWNFETKMADVSTKGRSRNRHKCPERGHLPEDIMSAQGRPQRGRPRWGHLCPFLLLPLVCK